MTIVRLSPSGPEIENPYDGPLDIGPGAFLRVAEQQGSGTAVLCTASPQPYPLTASSTPNLQVSLANPKAEYGYLVECQIDGEHAGTSTGESVQMDLVASFDSFATPGTVVASVVHSLGPETWRSCPANRSLQRGDVFAGGIPDGTAELAVRLEFSGGTGISLASGTGAGAAWLRLVETF